MLELLPNAGVIDIVFICFYVYCVYLSNIKVSKDTGVPYKTTNNLGIYLKEEMNCPFYFKKFFALDKLF